ncbi:MAG: ABC transporter ATP-binding protein [Chloroflexi bacterium]|nr:MAG: ABC transporter ATP-binding protein [Chloroflexota bacterium]
MDVIETTDLTKIYQNRYIALNAMNMRVEKGMVYGLVGPNGAGKSTTFRILLGLQRPTAGSVKVLGEEMTAERSDIRRRVGFLPTNPSFPRNLTPIEYLEFVGAVMGMPSERTKIRLATLLQAVDMTSAAGQRIEGLSTGMVTRLGIAAALMNDPELLILDEPTSGLDPAGRKETIELIRELSGRDRTIIIATHILGDVERVCSDVGIISQGRIIYSGPMAEMRRLARHGTIVVEIEGNTTAFEQQIPLLDDVGAVRWERLGSEFRMSFMGAEPLPVYIHRVLDLIDRTGVDLLHFNTGTDEIEEAFLRRLEEDRTRGFLRASAWAATQRLAGHDTLLTGEVTPAIPAATSTGATTGNTTAATAGAETVHAGVLGPPSV